MAGLEDTRNMGPEDLELSNWIIEVDESDAGGPVMEMTPAEREAAYNSIADEATLIQAREDKIEADKIAAADAASASASAAAADADAPPSTSSAAPPVPSTSAATVSSSSGSSTAPDPNAAMIVTTDSDSDSDNQAVGKKRKGKGTGGVALINSFKLNQY